jgi:hypothetical protein
MNLLLIVIYIILLVFLIGYSMRLCKKEKMCLCSGPQIYRECKDCTDMFAGVAEFTEQNMNFKGGPKNMKWPYDVIANGYQEDKASDCPIRSGIL